VIPRFPKESSGVRLLYASLITASQSWRGVKMTADIWWELEGLTREAFRREKQEVRLRARDGVECLNRWRHLRQGF